MADQLDELCSEYDDLVVDTQNSGYQTFPHNLQRWFLFLDSSAPLAGVVLGLESSVEFEIWYQQCLQTMGGMVGSARLEWPEDSTQQLGLKLGLFRSFSDGRINPPDFCLHFLFVRGDFNAAVANLISQLFSPMARELRRYIRRQIEQERAFASSIPATDRIVHLDHNSAAYSETIEALEKTEQAVATANDYDDAQDKDQRLAELSAIRRLLTSTRVRIGAVTAIAGPTLAWLAEKFAGGVISQLASATWKLIMSLFI
jgi:hypothetical protein